MVLDEVENTLRVQRVSIDDPAVLNDDCHAYSMCVRSYNAPWLFLGTAHDDDDDGDVQTARRTERSERERRALHCGRLRRALRSEGYIRPLSELVKTMSKVTIAEPLTRVDELTRNAREFVEEVLQWFKNLHS